MTKGLGGRLPDENRWTQQQVQDSMLLFDAITTKDLPQVKQMVDELPRPLIEDEVLSYLEIADLVWFWQNVTDEESFQGLLEAMHSGTYALLIDAMFTLGVDFSYAPLDYGTAILVTEQVNEYLMDTLPEARYNTLQLILRLVQEDQG